MPKESSFTVINYNPQQQSQWDNFVRNSKNGTFLHLRKFMDYHANRFKEASLMVYEKNKLIALLPANREGTQVFSHQGLTYGDLLLSKKIKFYKVLEAFKAVLQHLEKEGVTSLRLKRIPSIYHQYPSEELEYLFFLLQAKNVRTDLSATILQTERMRIQANRIEGVKKAHKKGLTIQKTSDFEQFWNQILLPNLAKQYGASPVHSLTEIQLLAKRFPKNIHQYVVFQDDRIVGGCTVFETKQVAHIQYISADDQRQQLGTLDFLFQYLIEEEFAHKAYFDFGTSNENMGRNLNEGLLYWKECFGARSMAYKTYQIQVEQVYKLENIFV